MENLRCVSSCYTDANTINKLTTQQWRNWV
jgi:hypothetical protein